MTILERFEASWGSEYTDSPSRRVILLSKGTPVYKVEGYYAIRHPWNRDYDEVALVMMTPFQRQCDIEAATISSDGVAFVGELELTLRINDNWDALSAICINIDEEIAIACGRAQAAIQSVISKLQYSVVLSDLAQVSESLNSLFNRDSEEQSTAIAICEVRISNLSARSDKLTKARINRAEKIEELEIERQQRKNEAERREVEAKAKFEEEKRNLELERLRAEQKLSLSKAEEEAALDIAKKRSELTKTEEGLLALDLTSVLKFKTDQLKIKEYIAKLDDGRQRDLMRALVGFQAGQNNVLASFAANQIGISLRDSSAETAESIKGLLSSDKVPPTRIEEVEQDGTGQPATRPESNSEGGDNP